MSHYIPGALDIPIQTRPLNESIVDEWWAFHPSHPVWIGDRSQGDAVSSRKLPPFLGGGDSVLQRMYDRLLCTDVCVTVDEQHEDSFGFPPIFAPVVWLHEVGGKWWRAISYQSLYSMPEIMAVAGRPPWPFTVEIQPTYGRGLANEGCVTLRLGKIGHAQRGR